MRDYLKVLIMNELIYGNPSQSQKTKLLQKAGEIANSIS